MHRRERHADGIDRALTEQPRTIVSVKARRPFSNTNNRLSPVWGDYLTGHHCRFL
jgi:hypothetical protein